MTALQRRRFITFTGAVSMSSARLSKRDSADNMIASRHHAITEFIRHQWYSQTRSLSENTENFNILAWFLNNF